MCNVLILNILLVDGHNPSFLEQEEFLAGLEHGLKTLLEYFRKNPAPCSILLDMKTAVRIPVPFDLWFPLVSSMGPAAQFGDVSKPFPNSKSLQPWLAVLGIVPSLLSWELLVTAASCGTSCVASLAEGGLWMEKKGWKNNFDLCGKRQCRCVVISFPLSRQD